MQLSIIIVSYNVKYFLEQCLVSVINASKNIQAEIWVVDNCSQDGSRGFFEGRFPAVKFIWHTANVGFSAANNLALKEATGEKILFLNPDTILPEDCLEKCLDFFDQQPKPGATGIRMIDGSGIYLKESKRGFPSPLTSFFKMTGIAAAFPSSSLFASYYLGHLPADTSNEVDVLSGAFMMISKKVLDITGGFDEAFFMYGEDIDLSYRIQKAGYKNYYFAGSSIIHFKGESTKKNSPAYINAFYGAMELFVKKHHAGGSAFFYRFLLRITIIAKKLAGKFKQQAVTKILLPNGLITLIVTDSAHYNLIKHSPGVTGSSLKLQGRVANENIDDAVTTIDKLAAFVTTNKIEHIIFCDGEVSISNIIKVTEQLPEYILFSYHLSGTKSIISSSDKNKSGLWIALDDLH